MDEVRSTMAPAREEGRGRGGSRTRRRGGGARSCATDFSETAFFQPHLLLDPDGSGHHRVRGARLGHRVERLGARPHPRPAGGLARAPHPPVKELMVRPYLPRFLREGDRADLKVVGQQRRRRRRSRARSTSRSSTPTPARTCAACSASIRPTRRAACRSTVEPGGGTDLELPGRRAGPGRHRRLPGHRPRRRLLRRRAAAAAGAARPDAPRPVALRDPARRRPPRARLRRHGGGADPTLINDQLVVTVDAQLFYSVLNALPYLVNYPYECTEQTLNRFLSTGILSSLYDRYPAVAADGEAVWRARHPARDLGRRPTPTARWRSRRRRGWSDGPRRRRRQPDDLINVLDPRIAEAQRALGPGQARAGADLARRLPLVPGRAAVAVHDALHPVRLRQGARVRRRGAAGRWSSARGPTCTGTTSTSWCDMMMRRDCCWEIITFLNYVLSSYPDESWTGGVFTADDRQRMLDFSFRPLEAALAAAQGLPGADPAAGRPRRRRPAGVRLGDGLGQDRPATSAPSGRPRTAPGSGTTTPSRPTPSRSGR